MPDGIVGGKTVVVQKIKACINKHSREMWLDSSLTIQYQKSRGHYLKHFAISSRFENKNA